MTTAPSAVPLRPSPDRAAAGDQTFDPTRHLWVDSVWWSLDGYYRWTGFDWERPPSCDDVASNQEIGNSIRGLRRGGRKLRRGVRDPITGQPTTVPDEGQEVIPDDVMADLEPR
jgi:hypothetical protein